ncbi:DNA repair protein XRCC1 isoform X2 [Rhinatrema bivittatum]|uniref:DNA repair protein XRCC1 isoform X2 n=1 Tax=Rhinatrema bivittatum TaxID=194408 RepID=UPI00112A1A85|nr:DNA repair protein XRCC1 isoform X2 [Rhinatrema bivittatum]
MPEIKVKHVVSCSSEDSTHRAENLLKADTYRKWRSSRAGEKQVSVILQFEKEEQIHSIDVGNECSAFVEVLVGHSTSVSEQDYEVILVTSSFMSPAESKSSSSSNRVRMFGPEKLVKGTAEKKWDRVKIVCTQPYNKNLSYGLSFIRFHSPPDPSEAETAASSVSAPRVTKLGQFVVKEEENSSSAMKPGSLFFNRAAKSPLFPSKALQNDQPSPSYAAATLQASSAGDPGSAVILEKSSAKTPSPKESNLVKRKFEFGKESPLGSSARKSDPKEQAKASPRLKENPSAQPAVKKLKVTPPPVLSGPAVKGPATPQTVSAPGKVPGRKKRERPTEVVEFHHILKGTVFVLSGFQNPFRSQLRDKALEMGAKYRPDWTPDCTHLICAFANTPKYSQVKAMGGTIVQKDWILDCHKRKQRLSHNRYRMDSPQSRSEEEDNGKEDALSQKQKADYVDDPISDKPPPTPELKAEEEEEVEEDEEERPGPSRVQHDEDHGGSTDEGNPEQQDSKEEDSDRDTEDELRSIVDINQKKQRSVSNTAAEDPYGGSTDENTDVEEEDLSIPELPDFFLGKHFLLYGDFPPPERRMLSRYITAFNGELEEYMNEKVNYVITMQEWDDTFEEALIENANLSFVKPRWIYTCNERQKLIPHQPFVVVPQS